MGRKIAAGLLVLAVLLGGGWLALRHLAETRLASGIAQFRASLGPDGRFTYATAHAVPLRLGADFTGVSLRTQGITLTADHATLGHVGARALGSMMVEHFRMDANGVHIEGARLDADDVEVVGDGAPNVTNIHLGSMVLRDQQITLPSLPEFAVRMASVAVDQQPHGRGELTRHVIVTGGMFTHDGAAVTNFGPFTQTTRVSGGVSVTRSEVHDFVFPASAASTQTLSQLGYADLHGSMQGVMRYQTSGSGPAQYGPFSMRFDGLGTFVFSAGLDHLPTMQGRFDATHVMQQARLTGATLTYDDAGLAGRALALMARRSRMQPEQFGRALAASLEMRAAAEMPGPQQAFEQQAARFLGDPRRFTITMQPPSPLPLSSVPALRALPSQPEAAQALGLGFKAD